MIAMSLGELRPGDILPSIRELEESLGVGRAIIRRVYLELGQQGLLDIQHGRRISVRDVVLPATDTQHLSIRLDKIVKDALEKARRLNVNDISFARYLLSRALEENRVTSPLLMVDWNALLAAERAQEISEVWGVPVTPVVLGDLADFLAQNGTVIRHIISTYYRYEIVQQKVHKANLANKIDVIPINVQFKNELVRKIRSFPRGSKIWLFSEPKEFYRKGRSFVEIYEQVFGDTGVQFHVKEAATEQDVLRTIKSPKCDLVILNTLLWSKISETTRNLPKVTRTLYQIDRETLEAARVRAGIFALSV